MQRLEHRYLRAAMVAVLVCFVLATRAVLEPVAVLFPRAEMEASITLLESSYRPTLATCPCCKSAASLLESSSLVITLRTLKLLLLTEMIEQDLKAVSRLSPMSYQEISKTDTTLSGILVCVITDAPLLPHQLRRVAARAGHGIVAVGGHGVGYNSSGDIIIALSNSEKSAPQVLFNHDWNRPEPHVVSDMAGQPSAPAGQRSGGGMRRDVETQTVETVVHSSIDAIFMAAAEATEEAILNSLCQGEDLKAFDGTLHKGLDVEKVRGLLDKYRVQ